MNASSDTKVYEEKLKKLVKRVDDYLRENPTKECEDAIRHGVKGKSEDTMKKLVDSVERYREEHPFKTCSQALRKTLKKAHEKKRGTRKNGANSKRPRSPANENTQLPLLRDVANLCQEIDAKFPSERLDEDESTARVSDTSIWSTMKKNGVSESTQNLMQQMYRMQSSGNSNDCLIHTFLTSTCPVFRCLKKSIKNKVASSVRRSIIPDIMDIIKEELHYGAKEYNNIYSLLKDKDFLEDVHVGLLSKVFNIPILMLEGEKSEKIGKETFTQPPMAILHDDNAQPGPVHIFFNYDNTHFESVKIGDSYTISYDDAKKIANEYGLGSGGGRRGTRRLGRLGHKK